MTGGKDGPSRARGGRLWVLHPFLFAAASVLALYANNMRQATFADALPAFLGAVALAGALLAVFALARRRLDARAAILASVWVVVCLFHADLFGRLNGALGGGFPMLRSFAPALVLALAASVVVWRARWPAEIAHTVLNTIAAVMVATPLWQIAAFEWTSRAALSAYDAEAAAAALPQEAGEGADGRAPDIFYFVFDRYAARDTLRAHYDYDDGALAAFLEDKGFYLAPDSRSNYFKTGHSLASTFHMDYLDFLAEAPVGGADWRPIHAMLDDHRVGRFLKARGYRFVQFGSWWRGTHRSPLADANRPHGFSEFDMIYLRRTALRPLFHLLPASRATMRLHWDNAQCQRVGPQMEEVKRLGGGERPVFAFVHVLVPHGPYVFGRDGACLSRDAARERGSRQGYVDQIAYAGAIIRDMVDTLTEEGRDKPVIVIQADEGPFPERAPGTSWREASDEQIQIKTSILNAYYFPNGAYDALYPDITPVNSFRVLFNAVFGTEFALLPDRVTGFTDDRHIYDFFDVTRRADRNPRTAGRGGQAPTGLP